MKLISTASKRKFLLTLLCSVVISATTVYADQTQDALNELEKAVEKEIAQRKPDEKNPLLHPYGDMSAMLIANLRMSLARNDRNLENSLPQLAGQFKSEEVKKAIEKLQATIEANRKAEEAAFDEQIKSVLSETAEAIRNAKKPTDLDGTFKKLEAVKKQWEAFRYRSNRYSDNQIDAAWRIASYWQDYLANEASGRFDAAINNLDSASREQLITLIPRSEILARIDTLKKAKDTDGSPTVDLKPEVQKIIQGAKSLTDIPKALDALAELERSSAGPGSSNRNRPIQSANRELNLLLQGYREYQVDLPLSHDFRPNNASTQSFDAYADTLHLRIELLRLVAPRILQASKLKPKADESINQYLDRVMEKAQESADVRMIARVQDLKDKLTGRSRTIETRKQLQTTLAGQNQEEAGQWMLAVISYHEAIRNGSELVPAAAIAKRLDAIKAKHPKEFEAAMAQISQQTPSAPAGRFE